ncbi:MAG: hypothetical protein ACYS30_23245 [Planctomycetota bacterium]|jgi:hypothetical protein
MKPATNNAELIERGKKLPEALEEIEMLQKLNKGLTESLEFELQNVNDLLDQFYRGLKRNKNGSYSLVWTKRQVEKAKIASVKTKNRILQSVEQDNITSNTDRLLKALILMATDFAVYRNGVEDRTGTEKLSSANLLPRYMGKAGI